MTFQYKTVEYDRRVIEVPVAAYNYQPLDFDQKQFRLLAVLPSTTFDDPIECKLHHYSLKDAPFYSALSYQWGDPSEWQSISVDGAQFPVGINLHGALQQLRARQCPLLWVDAICINQEDTAEKSRHVPLMKQIYHHADCVSVWLGQHSNGSENIMDMIRAIDVSRRAGSPDRRGPWMPSPQVLRNNAASLRAFFQRPYWQRVWIIQEIASASNITIFCGVNLAQWRGLELLLPLVASDAELEVDLDRVQHLFTSRAERVEGRPVGLLQALHESRFAQATDVRDKVFALLGLTFDREQFVQLSDYNWKLPRMCFEMTRSVIRTKKSLDIIFAGPSSMKLPETLPSWMPDYVRFGRARHTETLASLARYISGEDERYRCGRLSRRWNATGQSVVDRDIVHSPDGTMMRVRGHRFATINALAGGLSDEQSPQHLPSAMEEGDKPATQFIEDLCSAYTFYDKSYEQQGYDARMAQFLFRFDDFSRYDWSQVSGLAEQFQALKIWRERNKSFTIRGQSLSDLWSTWDTLGRDIDGWRVGRAGLTFASRMASRAIFGAPPPRRARRRPAQTNDHGLGTVGRIVPKTVPPGELVNGLSSLSSILDEGLRLMTTEEDHIGWAHPAAELGDKIYLLQGCSMPAILRPSRVYLNTYDLIGHAYVQGVMNDELWSTLQRNQLQNITLS